MKRREDWPVRLGEFIESRRSMPFRYGENDCCLFAADAVKAMTGDDLAAAWRGKYRSAREALKFVRDAGGLPKLVSTVLSETVAVALAQRGDVLLVPRGDREQALAICAGEHFVWPGPEGIELGHTLASQAAWRI